ncbi:MAG: GAF domain-containing protein [Nitrospirae bacterium]|nr:GAF domain-containing protein [Nitrospirota bacterium]
MVLPSIFKSFKTKITFSILGVGLLVVFMGLSVTYRVARNHLQNTIGAQYRELATETSQKVWSLIEANIKAISLLALSSDVRTGIELANAAYSRRRMTEADIQNRIETLKTLWSKSRGADDPFARGFLTNSASDYIKGSLRDPADRAEHLSIIVTDQRGILVGADAKPPKIYYGDEPWWLAAFDHGRGSVYISDVQTSQEATEEFEKLYTLSIAVPVMEATGRRAIGVIKTDLQIKRFFEAVTQVHVAKSDHTMLAGSDGTLIFCPIFLIRNHSLQPALMQAIFKDDPGWAATTEDVHYHGQNAINGFAPVHISRNIHPSSFGGKRWYIFTSQDPVETYAPVNTLLNWILFSGVLGSAVLLFLGLRAADYIVRPIRDLQKGVKLIGFGNLHHRLKIHTGDEIQELADEFNEMAIKLQASYTSLERRVYERTKELAVVNKITRMISSKLDIHEIFESLSDEVSKLLHYDRISVALLDESRQQIQLRLIKTKDAPMVVHDTPRSKNGTVIGWVVDHRQPYLRADVLEAKEFHEDGLLVEEGMRSYIVVPIISQNKPIGTFNLASRRPRTYSERNLEILIPIAEQVAIAVETIRLFEQTKKLDQLKSEFVSKVSHELRTPLTSIKGFTEILLSYKDVDKKTRQEFISIINEESDRLTRLINDILDLSKIEAGKAQWQIRPLSPFEIVVHAVKSIRAMALEKNLPILVEVPETLPSVRGDRDQLIQVLDNLLSNAIKFSNIGNITLRGAVEDKTVRISVIDTGIGIPASDLEKIFDKFHQLEDTRSGKPRGTGLGLAICREIIAHLGGKIWCESWVGQGSRFHFTLPVWSDTRPSSEPTKKLEPAAVHNRPQRTTREPDPAKTNRAGDP